MIVIEMSLKDWLIVGFSSVTKPSETGAINSAPSLLRLLKNVNVSQQINGTWKIILKTLVAKYLQKTHDRYLKNRSFIEY